MTKTRDLADLGGGFIQAGTGSVQRTVESKLQETVSVKDFGAVGDGVTDDTAAIQAALSSSHVNIYVPAGRYRITSNLTRSGQTYLHGDGLVASAFVFDGNYGLDYNGGDGTNQYTMSHLSIEKMAFETTVKNTRQLIDATWFGGVGNTAKALTIRDCEFKASGPSAGFAAGVRLINARNVRIDNVRFLGDRDAAPINTATGLQILGGGDAAPVEIQIDSLQTYYCQTGLYINGWVEGIYVDKSTFVACLKGIEAVGSPEGRPVLHVSNSHFATSTAGVLNTGFVQVKVCNNSFYAVDVDGTASLYSGVQFNAPNGKLDSLVSGNDFQCFYDPGSTYGIVISNDVNDLENCVITSNTISAFDIGILLASTTTGITITDSNILYACGIADQSTFGNNKVEVGTYTTGGSYKTFGDGLVIQFGSAVLNVNANGEATLLFPKTFPNNAFTAIVNNGDSAGYANLAYGVKTLTTSNAVITLAPNPGAGVARINWVAFGN